MLETIAKFHDFASLLKKTSRITTNLMGLWAYPMRIAHTGAIFSAWLFSGLIVGSNFNAIEPVGDQSTL